jgi:hypothetical protein
MTSSNEKQYYIIFKEEPNFNDRYIKILKNHCDGNYTIGDYYSINNLLNPQPFQIDKYYLEKLNEIFNDKNLALLNMHHSVSLIKKLCEEIVKGNKISLVETKNYRWNNL